MEEEEEMLDVEDSLETALYEALLEFVGAREECDERTPPAVSESVVN